MAYCLFRKPRVVLTMPPNWALAATSSPIGKMRGRPRSFVEAVSDFLAMARSLMNLAAHPQFAEAFSRIDDALIGPLSWDRCSHCPLKWDWRGCRGQRQHHQCAPPRGFGEAASDDCGPWLLAHDFRKPFLKFMMFLLSSEGRSMGRRRQREHHRWPPPWRFVERLPAT